MCENLKPCLYIVTFISAVIAIYEFLFWGEGVGLILAVLAGISAFYGYVLLKCCSCCKPVKKRR